MSAIKIAEYHTANKGISRVYLDRAGFTVKFYNRFGVKWYGEDIETTDLEEALGAAQSRKEAQEIYWIGDQSLVINS